MILASKHDAELVATVKAQLKLVASAAAYDADEAILRAVTGPLRFLLVESNLMLAWRATGLGGPMTFNTWSIVRTSPGDIVALCGGGDMLPGMPFSASHNAAVEPKSLDLSAFCSQTRVQIGEVKISTFDVIQYFANRRGGAHFDPRPPPSKKPKYELLRQLEAGEIECVPLRVNDRNLVHHEVLSIAQVVIRSPQVERLRQWQA